MDQQNPFESPQTLYEDFQDPYAMPLRHSGPGIGSTVLGALLWLAFCGGFILLAIRANAANQMPGGPDDVARSQVGLGFLLWACGPWVLSVLGTGLGLAGMVQSERKRVYPIIGLALNGSMLLLGCGGVGLTFIAAFA